MVLLNEQNMTLMISLSIDNLIKKIFCVDCILNLRYLQAIKNFQGILFIFYREFLS